MFSDLIFFLGGSLTGVSRLRMKAAVIEGKISLSHSNLPGVETEKFSDQFRKG